MGKVLAIGKGGKVFKVGSSEADAKWYVTDEVAEYAKTVKKGDEIELKSRAEGRNNILTFLKIVGSAPSTVSGTSSGNASGYTKKAWTPYEKPQDVQDSIRRQAVGHMTSRTLVGLQGQFDINNVCEIIDVLYAKYLDLTK
jgi:hypothetical protein